MAKSISPFGAKTNCNVNRNARSSDHSSAARKWFLTSRRVCCFHEGMCVICAGVCYARGSCPMIYSTNDLAAILTWEKGRKRGSEGQRGAQRHPKTSKLQRHPETC